MLSRTTLALTAAVSIALAMTATACTPPKADISAASEDPAPHPRAMADKYKRNPAPKQRYDITMTVANAPGPFGSVEGFAQYEAPDCWYTLDRIAGVPAIPHVTLPVSYTKVDDTTYVGTVYLDVMQDEDYFGRGICKWVLTSARVSLKATGTREEASFTAYVHLDDFANKKPVVTYFRSEPYPSVPEIEDYSNFGQTDRSQFAPYIGDNDLFTIALIPNKVRP